MSTLFSEIPCQHFAVHSRSGNFLVKKGIAPFPAELCAFARVFTAGTSQLEQWESCDDAALKKALLSPLQGTEDSRALEFLEKRCKQCIPSVIGTESMCVRRCTLLLASYRTSLQVSVVQCNNYCSWNRYIYTG